MGLVQFAYDLYLAKSVVIPWPLHLAVGPSGWMETPSVWAAVTLPTLSFLSAWPAAPSQPSFRGPSPLLPDIKISENPVALSWVFSLLKNLFFLDDIFSPMDKNIFYMFLLSNFDYNIKFQICTSTYLLNRSLYLEVESLICPNRTLNLYPVSCH